MNKADKKKSKTQMTKSELISLLKEHELTIKSLESNLDQLRNDRIALDTIVTDQDTSILITGLWVWAFARHSFHIGASGVVYSFAAFVFVSGFLRRNFRLIALSLLVVFQYGGMIWGVLPITEGVSWESHLLGGLTGVMLAYYYREIGRVEKKYDWEDEEDEPEFDDWKLPEQRDQEPIYRYIYKVKSEDDTKPKA